jgi:uridine kinase
MKQPYLIGIAGGTGSGKTTIATKIAAGLPPDAVAIIEHDSYYKDHSSTPLEERGKLNYDHPDALDSELFRQHLEDLRAGRSVEVPVYDFKSHLRLAETRPVEAKRLIIVEGILVFVERAIRDLLHMKLFVDTDADIRAFRRIRRDIEQRGRTFDSIREQYYRTVRPMHIQFVEPTKRFADVIIPEGGANNVALDIVVGKLLHHLTG